MRLLSALSVTDAGSRDFCKVKPFYCLRKSFYCGRACEDRAVDLSALKGFFLIDHFLFFIEGVIGGHITDESPGFFSSSWMISFPPILALGRSIFSLPLQASHNAFPRDSPSNTSGMRSTKRPLSSSAFLVPFPMAAILALPICGHLPLPFSSPQRTRSHRSGL